MKNFFKFRFIISFLTASLTSMIVANPGNLYIYHYLSFDENTQTTIVLINSERINGILIDENANTFIGYAPEHKRLKIKTNNNIRFINTDRIDRVIQHYTDIDEGYNSLFDTDCYNFKVDPGGIGQVKRTTNYFMGKLISTVVTAIEHNQKIVESFTSASNNEKYRTKFYSTSGNLSFDGSFLNECELNGSCWDDNKKKIDCQNFFSPPY